MTPGDSPDESSAPAMYHVDSHNPKGGIIDVSSYDDAVLRQISELMAAFGRLRDAERSIMRAAEDYMKLSETDMRALHFIILSRNRGEIATPGAIAAHLHISTASTTKLLDRLERGGHIERHAHPTDRRALAITASDATRLAATDSVGRQQSRRFYAAARLTAEEREVVTRFIDDMTQEISHTAQADQSDGAEASQTS